MRNVNRIKNSIKQYFQRARIKGADIKGFDKNGSEKT